MCYLCGFMNVSFPFETTLIIIEVVILVSAAVSLSVFKKTAEIDSASVVPN